MNKIIVLGLSLAVLSGCNSFKRVTGQIDDSTLPGQRVEVLPRDQTTQRDPAIVGDSAVAIAPPGAAVSDAVTQTQIDGAEMPGMPKAKPVDLAADCDPAVDLCPEPLAPEPVPPPTVTKKKIAAATTAPKSSTKVVDGTQVVDGTKAATTPIVLTKKKILKKKVMKPAVPGVPTPPTPQAQ